MAWSCVKDGTVTGLGTLSSVQGFRQAASRPHSTRLGTDNVTLSSWKTDSGISAAIRHGVYIHVPSELAHEARCQSGD